MSRTVPLWRCGGGTTTACTQLGNVIPRNTSGYLSGASFSLGQNLQCNPLGVSGTAF